MGKVRPEVGGAGLDLVDGGGSGEKACGRGQEGGAVGATRTAAARVRSGGRGGGSARTAADAGYAPSLLAYNAVLLSLSDASLPSTRHFLASMLRDGMAPNVYTYNILVRALLALSQRDKALGVVRDMRAAGCAPNVVTCNTLVAAFCRAREVDGAERLVDVMREGGVRRTFANCNAVRAVLRGFHMAVDERDVSMDVAFRRELQSLLAAQGRAFSLPQLLAGGRLGGGADEVRQLHEGGELRRLLEGAAGQDPAFVCDACGGVRFVPCAACDGSPKVFLEEEGCASRCADCNENSLVCCPSCSS